MWVGHLKTRGREGQRAGRVPDNSAVVKKCQQCHHSLHKPQSPAVGAPTSNVPWQQVCPQSRSLSWSGAARGEPGHGAGGVRAQPQLWQLLGGTVGRPRVMPYYEMRDRTPVPFKAPFPLCAQAQLISTRSWCVGCCPTVRTLPWASRKSLGSAPACPVWSQVSQELRAGIQLCHSAAGWHQHSRTSGPHPGAPRALLLSWSAPRLFGRDLHFRWSGASSLAVVCCWQTPAWLEQMIAHTTWRDLFYKLAEAHPDCLMLNFTVKVGRGRASKEGQKH